MPSGTKIEITEETRSQATETILLFEDKDMLQENETGMLENSCYTLLAVTSGELAEALLCKHRSKIDLLITDVMMIEINGLDLAVKSHTVCPNLKVPFISGYSVDVLDKQSNFEAGAHFFT